MNWLKFLLILFSILFLYRLLKNTSGYLRANHYVKTAYEGEFLKSDESRPAIEKILSQANMYNYEVTNYNLVRARAKFKSKILENFSIFFWIDTFIYFPVNVLSSLGIVKNTQSKIVSLLFSALWWLFTFVISLFSDEIKAFIISAFNSIQF